MINTAPLTGKTPIDPNTLGPSGEGITTHVIHDLGCTEPCTCGAWDKAVGGESEPKGTAAVFTGGPHDGETFTHAGMSWIETAEIDGEWLRIHEYVATDEHRMVYEWRGIRYSIDLPTVRQDIRRQT